MQHLVALCLAMASLAYGSTSGLEEEYRSFRQIYGRSCADSNTSAVSCQERFSIFAKNKAAIEARNEAYKAGTSTWKAKLNKFADFTEYEKKALLGYRRVGGWFANRGYTVPAGSSLLEGAVSMTATVDSSASFVEIQGHEDRIKDTKQELDMAEAVDWRGKAQRSSQMILNQEGCGSCWAMAAVGALEYHSELKTGKIQPLSWAQLVDCVPNPEECGGDGGCNGATAELAFEWVKKNGLAEANHYGGLGSAAGKTAGTASKCTPAVASVTSSGWTRLPENKLLPLMNALTNEGPVVVSVAAGSWMHYDSGIFDDCRQDAVIDHAVLLIGFGYEQKTRTKYWLIRNSWGPHWGEDGHIRLTRHDQDQGFAGWCGVDREPKLGVGCKNGPAELPVCGMCGILSDSSYPKGVDVKSLTLLKPLMRAEP